MPSQPKEFRCVCCFKMITDMSQTKHYATHGVEKGVNQGKSNTKGGWVREAKVSYKQRLAGIQIKNDRGENDRKYTN